MSKRAAGKAARFALLTIATALLCACATRQPFVSTDLIAGAPAHAELEATPFFPQTEHQCGPAALASLLGAAGVPTTPEELVPMVYIPARRGSLQVEMQAAPRKFGRLTYVIPGHFKSVLDELTAGRPVLILHNYGLPIWPRWHYAVVIGYDAAKDTLTLRSGRKRRQEMSARHFMVFWANGGRWGMVALRPGETAASANAKLYLESAADFERGASPEDSRLAFDAAVRRWPEDPVGWIGRGTAEYRAGKLAEAAKDYAAAVKLDAGNVGARNNLAQTLLDLGCPVRAREHLERIDVAALESPLRAAVADTRQHVDAAIAANPKGDAAACGALN